VYRKINYIPIGHTSKFYPKYDGPFKVLQVRPPNLVLIDTKGRSETIHENRVRPAPLNSKTSIPWPPMTENHVPGVTNPETPRHIYNLRSRSN